jgi:hypothetical protein
MKRQMGFFEEYVWPGWVILAILGVTVLIYKCYNGSTVYGQHLYAIVTFTGFMFMIFNYRDNRLYSCLDLEVIGGVLVISGFSPYIPIYVPFDVVPLIRVILELNHANT